MTLAGHPPRRSGRAVLPHPDLVSGPDVQPLSASRMRTSTFCIPLVRLCVRGDGCSCTFPLTGGLPSIFSAPCGLFEDFSGTTPSSDCPCSSIIGSRPQTSQCSPLVHLTVGQTRALQIPARSVSRHVWGLRPRRARFRLALSPWRYGLPLSLTRSALWCQASFRGSIPTLPVPLSTLRQWSFNRRI